jgi:hypothetical protein
VFVLAGVAGAAAALSEALRTREPVTAPA